MTSSYFPMQTSAKCVYDAHVARQMPGANIRMQHVSAREWDMLAHQFADIIPEQTAAYNVGHWGADSLEFATFYNKCELVGGAAIIIKKIPIAGTGIAFLKWGPVCHKPGAEFDENLYRSIISEIRQEYCNRRNFHLTVMPMAKPVFSPKAESVLYDLGFTKGETFAAPERYLVNVSDTAETLMKNLDQKWRYNLRKALKNSFDIRIVEDREGLDQFMHLYNQMLERKKFLDASAYNALQHIMEETPKTLRPVVVLVSHQGKVTAGGIFHIKGNMASYMFGATDERALRLKAGYAMHWWIAEYLCKNKDIHHYDLGGNDMDKGLHQFKKGFVGKSGQIINAPHRYHFAPGIVTKLVGFGAYQGRDLFASMKRKFHDLRNNK